MGNRVIASNLNLQNIPIRTDLGRKLRETLLGQHRSQILETTSTFAEIEQAIADRLKWKP